MAFENCWFNAVSCLVVFLEQKHSFLSVIRQLSRNDRDQQLFFNGVPKDALLKAMVGARSSRTAGAISRRMILICRSNFG